MTLKRIVNGIKVRTKRFFYNLNDVIKLKKPGESPRVYYLGVTEHSNLGDMAQCFCIRKWICENYPDYEKIEIRATSIVDCRFGMLKKLRKFFRDDRDIIVFQSGYTTTDLGGVHDLMHKMVCSTFLNAKILMMPQTIFFKNEERKQESGEMYSKAKKMLFLARDRVSFEKAEKMFNGINIKLFPDIVTTIIGDYESSENRDGVLFCIRNDSEKYFNDSQIDQLVQRVSQKYKVDIMDTTVKENFEAIQKNIKKYIDEMVKTFSKYKVIVTDRYHGTIFSLAANTPVIVIKTTDHKVKTGVEWFDEIYENICYEESLDVAVKKIDEYYQIESTKNAPYFYKNYYMGLKEKAEKIWNMEG